MVTGGGHTNADELDRKMDAFRARCHQTGLKVTPQRVAVYNLLLQSKDHPSAEMLYRRARKTLPDISLDTVNRTLLTLAQMGAANVVEGSGQPKRFDGCIEAHQHFRCTKCGRIIDLDNTLCKSIMIPREISRKYVVNRKTIYLEGICDLCRTKEQR